MYQCRVLSGSVCQMTLAKYLLVHQQKFGGGGDWLTLVSGGCSALRYYLHSTYTCNSEQLDVISVKIAFPLFPQSKGK